MSEREQLRRAIYRDPYSRASAETRAEDYTRRAAKDRRLLAQIEALPPEQGAALIRERAEAERIAAAALAERAAQLRTAARDPHRPSPNTRPDLGPSLSAAPRGRGECSAPLGRDQGFVVLAAVVDAVDLDGRLVDGEGDDGAAAAADRAQARPQIVAGQPDHRQLREPVAVVEDRGDVALGSLGEAGLLRDPEVEVGELLPGSRRVNDAPGHESRSASRCACSSARCARMSVALTAWEGSARSSS